MLLKQNATRKEKWKFFLVEIVVLLLLPKRPFRQVYHETTSDRVVVWCPRVDRGWFCYWKNLTIETEILRNIVESKTTNGAMVSQVSKVLHLCPEKSTSVSRKIPEFIPEEFLTFFHSLLKKFVYWKIAKPALARKISSCQQELEKIDPRSWNCIYIKVGTWYHSWKFRCKRLFQNRWQLPKYRNC